MQEELQFKCNVNALLEAALDGYSTTILAYGQTGSGKTYTILGNEEAVEGEQYKGHADDGLIVRYTRTLFDKLKGNRGSGQDYQVKASYWEVYNEQINDLLSDAKESLPVRWDVSKGFHGPGQLTLHCPTIDDVFRVLNRGTRQRKVSSPSCHTYRVYEGIILRSGWRLNAGWKPCTKQR